MVSSRTPAAASSAERRGISTAMVMVRMKDDEPGHDFRSSSGWLVLYVLQNKISNHKRHIYSERRSRTMWNKFPLGLQVAWYREDDCGSLGEAPCQQVVHSNRTLCTFLAASIDLNYGVASELPMSSLGCHSPSTGMKFSMLTMCSSHEYGWKAKSSNSAIAASNLSPSPKPRRV